MQTCQNHKCPKCDHEFDITITLGCVHYFHPPECPECNHEIDQEEVEPSESPEEENPFI